MSVAAILERLDTATGPDREIDLALALAFTGWCEHKNLEESGCQSDTGFDCPDCGADSWGNTGPTKQKLHDKVPSYTASLEAAVALAESLAPHGRIMTERDHNGWNWAMVRLTPNSCSVTAEAKSLPLALLSALLIALPDEAASESDCSAPTVSPPDQGQGGQG